MKTIFICLGLVVTSIIASAQTVEERLYKAVKQLQADESLKHAIISLYVTDTKRGKAVFDFNEEVGLAPASTQKIFTSIAAYDLLGADFHYNTSIAYSGAIANGILQGDLIVQGSGDPTFGSWRFNTTKPETIINNITDALLKAGIAGIMGNIVIDNARFSYQPLPGGWIWDDIGNYYGAGTWAINWNENQYDLQLQPGNKEGDTVRILSIKPALPGNTTLLNNIITGKAGSGDNGYIYLPPYSNTGFAEGTVPAGAKTFTISGAIPDPAEVFATALKQGLLQKNINCNGAIKTIATNNKENIEGKQLLQIASPSLDSMIYWFLQKSINLYGEAFTKTIAQQKSGVGATGKGVAMIKQFWQAHGIDSSALHIMDGSGLSPQNRVTTHALVSALQYARTRDWYQGFYRALPVYNNMKMKSGTITGAKAFAGYQTSSKGTQYTFAIIINNFDGNAAPVVQQMYKVLNELK